MEFAMLKNKDNRYIKKLNHKWNKCVTKIVY